MPQKPQPLGHRQPAPAWPALYTPEEAARLLRVGRTTLYAIMGRGELPYIRIGRLRRITPQALQAYRDAHHQESLP